jgi:hypothetical protein
MRAPSQPVAELFLRRDPASLRYIVRVGIQFTDLQARNGVARIGSRLIYTCTPWVPRTVVYFNMGALVADRVVFG